MLDIGGVLYMVDFDSKALALLYYELQAERKEQEMTETEESKKKQEDKKGDITPTLMSLPVER